MWTDEERAVERTFEPLLGCNTALAPTYLPPGTFRRMRNCWQGKIGAETKRPGTAPVTNTALTNSIEWLGLFHATQEIMAASNKKLYKFNDSTEVWDAVTGDLNRSDIYDTDYTDADSNLRKIIADSGNLKEYNNDTNTVSNIVPASDDASPAPPNKLTDLNAKGIRYVWTYSGYLFLAFEKSDEIWYSKRFNYNYFPSVQWERFIRNADYVNGQGIAFDDCCLIPMRRGWGVLTGTNFDNFEANKFLNTPHGVIAPRSIQRITYPDGRQTIAYLTDDDVVEVYDTGYLGEGSRRFSTRSLTRDKIDIDLIGLTDAEKEGAVGFFDASRSLYLLKFNRGLERIVYAYDTRNGQWYIEWDNIRANGFVYTDETLFFAGQTGHLHKFDAELATDWDDKDMTVGTPVVWDIYTDLIPLEDTGYSSYLDYLIVWCKQLASKSTLDIQIIMFKGVEEYVKFSKNQFMTWDVSEWEEAIWFHTDFTDFVGKPVRRSIKRKSPYFQIRFMNDRGEHIELYRFKMIGRATGY